MNIPVKIAVIGCGHWGPNHIRVFNSLEKSEVTMYCEKNEQRQSTLKKLFDGDRLCSDYHEVISSNNVDAVIIATPTTAHFEIAKKALENQKDVLCEKPLTLSVEQGEELVELAKKNERILMVGHVFVFNPGIRMLKEYIDRDYLGHIYHLSAIRTNLGPIREDINSVWDLASHDISIFSYLLGADPCQVTARGEYYLQDGIEDAAFVTLTYPERVLTNIHVSWLNPRKIREITVVGSDKMIIWDDLSNTGPISIFDKGVIREPYYEDFGHFQLLPREGDITIPKIKLEEPLKVQAQHFLECVISRNKPITDGVFGLRIIKTLDAIQKSMQENGAPKPF